VEGEKKGKRGVMVSESTLENGHYLIRVESLSRHIRSATFSVDKSFTT